MIDTINEKLALISLLKSWDTPIPISTDGLGQDDKQHLIWTYPGILFGFEPQEDIYFTTPAVIEMSFETPAVVSLSFKTLAVVEKSFETPATTEESFKTQAETEKTFITESV